MPPRKKELLVSFEESADKLSSLKPESMVAKAEQTLRARKTASAAKQTPVKQTEQPHPPAAGQPAGQTQEIVFQSKLDKKQRKESYTKTEFYIRNDLLARVKAMVQQNGKGAKTNLINYALEEALNALEKSARKH